MLRSAIILAVLLSVAANFRSYAQQKGPIVHGEVCTMDGFPLIGATVKLRGSQTAVSSDSLGRFRLSTPVSGRGFLICSSTGFESDSIPLYFTTDTLMTNFRLKEQKNELSGVNITLNRKLTDVPKTYTLNEFDVVTTAGAVADVAGALQTFPGASPAGNETGLFIHGGAANETQAFFDGMLVKNAFGSRLPDIANRSRFSAFLFDRTSFTTSSYPEEYGQALSSAFIMDTKGLPAGSSDEISLVSLGVGAAHTQRFTSSSLMVGANYYNFSANNQLIPQNISWRKDPLQYQASTHYKLSIKSVGMLKVYADYSDTQLSFDTQNLIGQKTDFLSNRNRNLYLNANFKGYIANSWKLFAGAAFNKTMESGTAGQSDYIQDDRLFHGKITLSRTLGHGTVFLAGAEQMVGKRAEAYGGSERGYHDVLSAAFSSTEIYFTNYLMLHAGLRSEYSAYMEKINLAPRTSLIMDLGKKNRFSFSYGIYYQKPDDSFLAQSTVLGYERSVNTALVYELKIKDRNLKVEAYHKGYKSLVTIHTPVFSGFQAYGPPLAISGSQNSGGGYARGFDLLWRDQSFPAGEYYVSYGYSDTKRKYIDYPSDGRPPYAPEHTFNLVARKFITKYSAQLSATYTFSSGRSYFNPNNPVFLADRTRNFQNLSLGVSYLPKWIRPFAVMNVNVSNVLGLDQVYGYRYSYDGSRQTPILPPAKRSILISFLMNFGDGQFNH